MNFSHSPSFPPSLNFLFLPHGEVNITYQRLVAWGKCFKIFLMLWSLISGSPKGKKKMYLKLYHWFIAEQKPGFQTQSEERRTLRTAAGERAIELFTVLCQCSANLK